MQVQVYKDGNPKPIYDRQFPILFLAILTTIPINFISCSGGCGTEPHCPPESVKLTNPSLGATFDSPAYITSPVEVRWEPDNCPMVVQIYQRNQRIFPRDNPQQEAASGISFPLAIDAQPYEIKIWIPGRSIPSASSWIKVVPDLKENLEEHAKLWEIYEENNPQGEKPACDPPFLSMLAGANANVLCLTRGGARYTNCHFYANLPPTEAKNFTFSLKFFIENLRSCNNAQGIISIPQALEFTISSWTGTERYEWAVQWENVGDGSQWQGDPPAWRIWTHQTIDSNYPDWLPIINAGNKCLSEDEWHTLRLEGRIAAGKVVYESFTVDNNFWDLSAYSYKAVVDKTPKRVAVAVQLNGNGLGERYTIYVDQVIYAAE